MPNPNYLKGRRKEYKVVNKYKEQGFEISQRTAGSHSPFDVIAVNKELRIIKLIQVKPDNFKKEKLNLEFNWLNNMFRVEFSVE